MSKSVPEARLISDYLEAFRIGRPNNEAPTITYENGWFVIRYRCTGNTPHRLRRAELVRKAARFRDGAAVAGGGGVTDAEIYAAAAKRRWPYVDEPRPKPRSNRHSPDATSDASEPRSPKPLIPSAMAENGDE